MRPYVIIFALSIVLFIGCSSSEPVTAPVLEPTNITQTSTVDSPGYIPWGFYDFEIARDGSSAEVVPNRFTNSGMWGYHMNVVKLLEVDPCTNCLSLNNIHLLGNGDVSVDISLKNPFMDRRYTGFDVRGIIMFPASQYIPDNDLRELVGLEPLDGWKYRIANQECGDAELVNPDGWTNAWASEESTMPFYYGWYQKYMPEGLPIFRYYPGKYASGETLSTLSAFIRFHSTDVRNMFEVGHTVTRTYIIRPPATGLIKASYAVYAHWYPADTVPVVDPAVDFPPEANSPLPYEFYITQDGPLDPDAPFEVNQQLIHWHIKTWSIGLEYWSAGGLDMMHCGTGGGMKAHPSGEPDDYMPVNVAYFTCWPALPDGLVSHTFLCTFGSRNPKDLVPEVTIGKEVYITNLEYAPLDGVW